jgi:lycopene cyclase-like protein
VRSFSSGLDAQVAVVGSGPAGLAAAAALTEAGVEAVLVSPAPSEVWPATYGCWLDELEPIGLSSVADTSWRSVRVVGHLEHDVPRAYAVLDNARLHRELSDRFGCAGGRAVVGAAIGAQHFGWGSRLLLADGRRMAVGLIVDATGGARPGLLRRAGPPRAHQTAFGLLARFDRPPIPLRSCTLMDWSPAEVDGAGADPRPTFLYALDLGEGRFLVEETALAASPPVAGDELRRRLVCRLERVGVTPTEVLGEEHVDIPLGGPLPRVQPVAATGAAAGLVHPATGYSVAVGLRAAPRLAKAVRRALDDGDEPARLAAAAWRAVWPAARRRARRLEQVGLSRLLAMSQEDMRSFFDSFFSLPVERWAPYLSGSGATVEVARAMAAVFRASPGHVRRRLARG